VSDENQSESPSPFTRPGFIISAIVVALIVVFGIILVVVNVGKGDAAPTPTSTSTRGGVSPSASPTPSATGDASVCGLDGVQLTGTVSAAPSATWKYEGTTGYPTSPTFGPGKTDPAGFRYCFQHSPTGALFAAANALAAPTDPAASKAWQTYFTAPGPYRDKLLAEEAGGNSQSGTRLSIAGFRMLSYDGKTAQVDIGGNGSSKGANVTFSAVYKLVWVDGDWKLDTTTDAPFDFAGVPNLAGYTAWGQ